MAEFCLDCWNKLNNSNFTEKEYVISREPDLCEECAQWKPVIIKVRRFPALYALRRCLFRRTQK